MAHTAEFVARLIIVQQLTTPAIQCQYKSDCVNVNKNLFLIKRSCVFMSNGYGVKMSHVKLSKIYDDEGGFGSYGGVKGLYCKLRTDGENMSRSAVKTWLSDQESYTSWSEFLFKDE